MEHVEYRIESLENDIAKARKRLALIDRVFGCAIITGAIFAGVILPFIVR